jgi:hypothetical protein
MLITDLLRQYLPHLKSNLRVLEIFSRCVLSGAAFSPSSSITSPEIGDQDQQADVGFWLSVGNEPIKYNETKKWIIVDDLVANASSEKPYQN